MKKWWISAVGILALLMLWELLAQIVGSNLILPGFLETLVKLGEIVQKPKLIAEIATTLWRVVQASALSLVFGVLLGFLGAKNRLFRGMLEPLLVTFRTVPVVAFILITLLWFNTSTIPVFSGVIMGFPIITQNILVASERRNPVYREMAELFELTPWQQFRHIQLPEVMGYLYAGIISTYGMCWKVVIAGEILALPKKGLGRSMQTAMMSLETPELIAYIVIAIICSAFGGKLLAWILRSYHTEREATW